MYDLHIHSAYSDGQGTIEEIVRKAKERRIKVIAITDHSIEHPRGLTEGKAKRRQEEIERARAKYDIEVLSGVECGIGSDGEIILPDFKFDIIIASIHECLPPEEYYRRIELCIKKHDFDVLGHFHSSIFDSYERIPERDAEILDLLSEHDIALEINTTHRAPPLDLLNAERKLKYSIGSDAHSLSRVGDVKWAIEVARRLKEWKFILQR
ncbi:PHP domain-containing protein [Archaeoglobus veneficus]|uniref:PHP domain protein n=1 Tax=Archaeoglobus veneficus (strain DSM 11195 / SNP6) TaxID=693661 RepID=F2KPJ8_ARCVS|nr:PHP domain-containing protein [Archaeoglobus veneficus]AEA46429.1 PHP domain protein [Archaeoglobus veneficus SNP6]